MSPALLLAFAACALLGLAALGYYAARVEPNRVEVTHHEVTFSDLSQELDGLTLCQVSDVHVTAWGRNEAAIAAAVRSVRADLYLLTGDMIHRQGGVEAFLRWFDELGEAIRPAVAILGNAEHKTTVDRRPLETGLAARGVPLLSNRTLQLAIRGTTLQIVGVDDPHSHHSRFPAAYRDADPGRFTLLLAHSPDACAERAGFRADLMLCGHTHGGQIRFPFVGAVKANTHTVRRLIAGWYEGEELTRRGKAPAGSTKLYVSRGLGMSGLGLRFNCPPELAVFTLRRA